MDSIFMPKKSYLICINQNDDCIISPFLLTNMEIRDGAGWGIKDEVLIEGQITGAMKILQPMDIDDITYEEILELTKE